nr:D-isomer specific 2-hydroxyacid dehydrogenase [Tanacetum cinerariifolium]
LPEKYFSTKDAKSLEAFLQECDVLVASLPDTAQTRYMLDAKKLGSLIRSGDIIKALDTPDGLFGAALDVTDPEPLPDNHPLWTHPKVFVTPHLSGDTEGEFDIAAEIAIANAERLRKGDKPHNMVDYTRGY